MLEMEFNAHLQGSQKSVLQLLIIAQCSFFPPFLHRSIGTFSLASNLPNSFQVRDFYVKIFPTVFFVFKAASLGEIDQQQETVNF